MAGSTRSWSVLASLTGLALVQPVACQRPTADAPGVQPGDAVIEALLADVWPAVVEPALGTASLEADALVDAVDAWSADPTNDALRAEAQAQFAAALEAWQVVEVMQIGPAGSSLTAVGGLDLRDEVYSWPTVNACRVDQETVERGFDTADFFEVELVNVTGFDALDTLLFADDEANDCPPQVAINADGSFAVLGAEGVRVNRADYALVIAQRIADTIDLLEQEWSPDGGDFAADLADAGASTSSFATQDEALNAVFDALFYLETATKDGKLGEPLGLKDCGSTSCMHLVEVPLSGLSHYALQANLDGFHQLYTGGEGVGLDDLLIDLGHADLDAAVQEAWTAARAAVDAVELPLDQALATDPTAAVAAHAAISELTTLLKGDVATVLFLQIPDEAAGDND